MTTSSQAFVEVYDIVHPHQFREALRGLRTSPFYPRQQQLGAFFFEVAVGNAPPGMKPMPSRPTPQG